MDDDVSGPHQRVAEIVREAALSWPQCRPESTAVLVFTPEDADASGGAEETDDGLDPYEAAFQATLADGEPVLILVVDLLDQEGERLLATLGATVAGDRLFCSRLHDTTHRPEPSDDIAPLEATGSLEDLARIAAGWFEEIVSRPVTGPTGRFGAWSFAATGTVLAPGRRWLRNGSDAT
ncbi:hypothetical protein [Streptomyces sp. NPDC127038]|uniref:hypothetical protein n=1 Tax=Streptomyces sp. NPDC127038 TaxID=3347114 RepID=UPI0036515215